MRKVTARSVKSVIHSHASDLFRRTRIKSGKLLRCLQWTSVGMLSTESELKHVRRNGRRILSLIECFSKNGEISICNNGFYQYIN